MDNCRSAELVVDMDASSDIDGAVEDGPQSCDDSNDTQLTPNPHSLVTTAVNSLAPLECLPNEVLLNVLGFLDVGDLLATSRVS